jgi:hypothetical protein
LQKSWKRNEKCKACGNILTPHDGEYLCSFKKRVFCDRLCRDSASGECSANWQGGLSIINQLVRSMNRYKEWRDSVFNRDSYKCTECGCGGALNAHHNIHLSDIIDYYKIKNVDDANECGVLWDVDNGITLCVKCHEKKHKMKIINNN